MPRPTLALAQKCIDFIDSSPTPFHLVATASAKLKGLGYTELFETDVWAGPDKTATIVAGGKYFYSRNCSTLVAFVVGGKVAGVSAAFKVVGAHSDSPVLKVKPVSDRKKDGYIQVGVECYGGGLWHTWFDRDLTLAGCVIVKTADNKYQRRLIHINKPILRVPNLCIHLQSGEERKAFAVNKENHLTPILSMVESTLNSKSSLGKRTAPEAGDKDQEEPKDEGDKRHSPMLLSMLATELKVEVKDIVDLELSLCDTQGGQVWGANDDFVSAPRFDNQVHCFTALEALMDHAETAAFAEDTDVSLVACFDHEEVGSGSAQGAASPVMMEAMERVTAALADASAGSSTSELTKVALRRSFLISADVAHAIHPNYSHKHECKHGPLLNAGTVIKTNDNQRYATNSVTGFFIRELARMADVAVQEFVVRNDCPCGTTIGPIISANTGLRTADVGVPSLSMHSIRETVGVEDITNSTQLFMSFFQNFRKLDDSCVFEGTPAQQ